MPTGKKLPIPFLLLSRFDFVIFFLNLPYYFNTLFWGIINGKSLILLNFLKYVDNSTTLWYYIW